MEILFLGTGASEWDLGNRLKSNYRRKSSLLVDRKLLVDAGPDIFTSETDFSMQGLYTEVDAVLQTHSHRDHLSLENTALLCASRPRTILGDKVTLDSIGSVSGLRKISIEPYIPVQDISMGGYILTALEANHPAGLPGERPYHYIIEGEGRRVFYGCDGAWLLFRTWSYIRKLKFDLVILDGTTGELDGNLRNFEHNNLSMVRLLSLTFRENGLIAENGKIMISHMAMSLHGTHAEIESALAGSGVMPAFDGMKIDV